MKSLQTELERETARAQRTKPSFGLTGLCILSAGIALFCAAEAMRDDALPRVLAITAVGLAGLITAYALWRMERSVLRLTDELEQRIRLEAMAVAFAVALALLMLISLQPRDGLLDQIRPRFLLWMPVLWTHGLAIFWLRRRYR